MRAYMTVVRAAVLALAALGTGAAIFIGVEPPQALGGTIPDVTGARIGGDATRTRFVADLTAAVRFNAYVLSEPYRVVVDLEQVDFQLPSGLGNSGRGLIKSYRYGLIDPGRSRIVMDAAGPCLIDKTFLIGPENGLPARMVIDVVPTTAKAFAAARGAQKGQPPEENRNQLSAAPVVDAEGIPVEVPPGATGEGPFPSVPTPEQPSRGAGAMLRDMATALLNLQPGGTAAGTHEARLRTIVIDPGHGGIDPGAIGKHGTMEKSIVLAFAKELQSQLSHSEGYRVVLTRNTDIFLSLKERVQIGRQNKADLFIAVHADAVRGAEVRGATVYTLSETASDAEADQLAHEENRSDLIAGVDLAEESDEITGILIDLAQRESKNHSVYFAKSVVGHLQPVIELTTRPVRSAGFRVLKAPDVPSVLLELGYLSSDADERLLLSEAWRKKVAGAVGEAIDSYFGATLASGG